jgi:hypothetical protein
VKELTKQKGKQMNQKQNGIGKGIWLLAGLSLGAGMMYLFDPDRGRRRRAILRDKCKHTLHQTGDTVSTIRGACRDLSNRSYGFLVEVKHRFQPEKVDDDVLVARVRSKLGHVASHPSGIEVSANDGNVLLRGSIPANELNDLIFCVSGVRGVNEVESRLKIQNPSIENPETIRTTEDGKAISID